MVQNNQSDSDGYVWCGANIFFADSILVMGEDNELIICLAASNLVKR
jgi:hypothetical protein